MIKDNSAIFHSTIDIYASIGVQRPLRKQIEALIKFKKSSRTILKNFKK